MAWFRRDLRLADNPALLDALTGEGALALFVLDPVLWAAAGAPRRAYLAASLHALDADLRARGGALCVRHGDPVAEVLAAARAVGAARVHVAADFAPYGAARDLAVEQALAPHGIELIRTGSPYAVAPGRLRSGAGTPFRVYTPFAKAWAAHGWRAPVQEPVGARWLALDGDPIPDPPVPAGLTLPRAGEAVARERWRDFLSEAVGAYDTEREVPGHDGSSRMSVHLKWGEIHPRTMLADLARLPGGGGPAAATYRKELAWREFYADVLHARPETAREPLRAEFARMQWDEPAGDLDAWCEGRTGFPIVDAGMRQLRATGWMHNRVRMIVASFLVKDLHLHWRHGARHFMQWLLDADLASNQHNWQWVAGSGTDASPFFRVFNPTVQARSFDPDGSYVRRWVPELREAADPHAPAGVPGYPAPLVEHAEERREALRRWERIRT